MSWDLDADEARDLIEEYLAAMPPPQGDEWIVTHVAERDWGWVISWLNRRAAEGSTDTSDLYAGGGPYLVDRETGEVAMCGSAKPVESYVEEWHRGELPNIPRP